MDAGVIAAIVLGALLLIFVLVILILMPCKAYFTAFFSGCYISAFRLIGMKMRKLNTSEIVNAYIMAKKSRLGLTLFDVQLVFVSGGNAMNIVKGMIAAKAAKLNINFDFLRAVDIAGRDVLEVVRECINTKTIELPLVTSLTRDKREVNVKISLTLKVNLKNYLKGVGEDTISARAVETVVTKISNSKVADELISHPEYLDKAIFDADVDEDSKFELVSADVIHIDLGHNRAFDMEKEALERNRIVASNQLEQRRLTAMAVEKEMKAKAEELRCKTIENEAEVPKAIIKAIEEGKMKDVVDYYKLQNLQADTEMRRKFMENPKKNDFFDE